MRFADWVKHNEKVETAVAFKKLNSTPIKDLIGATDMELFAVVKNSLDNKDLWINFFYDLQNGYPDPKINFLYDAYNENIITKEKDVPIVYIKGMEDKCLIYHYPLLHENQKDRYYYVLVDNTLENKIEYLKRYYIDKYLSPHVPQSIHDFIGNGLLKISVEREGKKEEKNKVDLINEFVKSIKTSRSDFIKDIMEKEIGRKDDKDKLRFDLISPYALEEIAKVLTFGANKYGDRNWEKGLTYDRLLGAMYRHINAFQQGNIIDVDSGCHHMASAAFCAMAILHFHKTNNFSKEDGAKYEPADRA